MIFIEKCGFFNGDEEFLFRFLQFYNKNDAINREHSKKGFSNRIFSEKSNNYGFFTQIIIPLFYFEPDIRNNNETLFLPAYLQKLFIYIPFRAEISIEAPKKINNSAFPLKDIIISDDVIETLFLDLFNKYTYDINETFRKKHGYNYVYDQKVPVNNTGRNSSDNVMNNSNNDDIYYCVMMNTTL